MKKYFNRAIDWIVSGTEKEYRLKYFIVALVYSLCCGVLAAVIAGRY